MDSLADSTAPQLGHRIVRGGLDSILWALGGGVPRFRSGPPVPRESSQSLVGAGRYSHETDDEGVERDQSDRDEYGLHGSCTGSGIRRVLVYRCIRTSPEHERMGRSHLARKPSNYHARQRIMTQEFANLVPHREDEVLVQSFLALYRDHSNRAAASELGVSEATIRRWRRGEVSTPLQTRTRVRLRNCMGDPAIRWAGAWRSPDVEGADGVTRHDARASDESARVKVATEDARYALVLFGSVDRIVDHLGAIAPPGIDRARKRYVLEGIRHVITALEPLPPWWYELVERVEGDEI